MPKDKMSKKKKANNWRSGSRFKSQRRYIALGAVWAHVKLTPTLTTMWLLGRHSCRHVLSMTEKHSERPGRPQLIQGAAGLARGTRPVRG
jgi:hypothetical protein